MSEQEKIKALQDHLRYLKNWFLECGSISDDESEMQINAIDEMLEQTSEGV